GLNCGLHDAHNLAWKLALAIRGRGRAPLLDSFAAERRPAARHILDVSDKLHAMAKDAVTSARTGRLPSPMSPHEAAALTRSRCMLDVSYAYSPLTGEYLGPDQGSSGKPGTAAARPARAGAARAGTARAGTGRAAASTAGTSEPGAGRAGT